MALCYPMALGLNKGCGRLTKHTKFLQDMIWEVCTLRAAHHGTAQGVQGQAHAQVHQEEGGQAHHIRAMWKAAAKKD
ncbi:60S ribosomal protein L36 [Sigmodon hispidus]